MGQLDFWGLRSFCSQVCPGGIIRSRSGASAQFTKHRMWCLLHGRLRGVSLGLQGHLEDGLSRGFGLPGSLLPLHSFALSSLAWAIPIMSGSQSWSLLCKERMSGRFLRGGATALHGPLHLFLLERQVKITGDVGGSQRMLQSFPWQFQKLCPSILVTVVF